MPKDYKVTCLAVCGLLFASFLIALVYIARRLAQTPAADAEDTRWNWGAWDSATVGIVCGVTLVVVLTVGIWYTVNKNKADMMPDWSFESTTEMSPNLFKPYSNSRVSSSPILSSPFPDNAPFAPSLSSSPMPRPALSSSESLPPALPSNLIA